MTPREKAIELINDSLQLQPPNDDLQRCYETAKLQALYCALAVRRTHEDYSQEYSFWLKVKSEIEKL